MIGVVKNFHFTNFKNKIKPFAFLYRKSDHQYITVKTKGGYLSNTLTQIENTWSEVVPGVPMDSYFQDQTFNELYNSEDRLSKVLMFITGLAIFIAFIGMFAMTNLTIKDKLKELVIRKVLGASEKTLILLVVRNFVFVIIIANLLAWPIGYFAMGKWLNSFAYRIDLNIWFFLASIIAKLFITGITVGYQSMRAARSNPINSLSIE